MLNEAEALFDRVLSLNGSNIPSNLRADMNKWIWNKRNLNKDLNKHDFDSKSAVILTLLHSIEVQSNLVAKLAE